MTSTHDKPMKYTNRSLWFTLDPIRRCSSPPSDFKQHKSTALRPRYRQLSAENIMKYITRSERLLPQPYLSTAHWWLFVVVSQRARRRVPNEFRIRPSERDRRCAHRKKKNRLGDYTLSCRNTDNKFSWVCEPVTPCWCSSSSLKPLLIYPKT